MVLTALPDGAAEDGLARGAEAWMIIGNDIGDTAQCHGQPGVSRKARQCTSASESAQETPKHPAALVGAIR